MFHVEHNEKEMQKHKEMTKEELKSLIRNVPDFPQPGIQFKDITTVLKNPECLKWMKQEMVKQYQDLGITKILGMESRGFIMAPILATEIGAGFVPVRKPGKLPADTISISYDKEYGKDTLEIHKDALVKDDIVLIHDDLLATGGTVEAVISMVKKIGVKRIYVNFLIELEELGGRKRIDKDIDVVSLVKF